MVSCWQCPSLPPSPLYDRLKNTCKTCHFRYGKILLWPPMDDLLTAAIIGTIYPFRYILFTKNLLKQFPDEEIEAILIHEIGHSYRKHLIFYPFIFLGLIVLFALFSLLLQVIDTEKLSLLIKTLPQSPSNFFLPFMAFIGYVILFTLYFRFVFGSFSRLFERQADLHIFHTPLPPHTMAQALEHLAQATGNTHHEPNWHHGSLHSRIDFLYRAIDNPSLVQQHHRKVYVTLSLYFFFLFLGILFLILI